MTQAPDATSTTLVAPLQVAQDQSLIGSYAYQIIRQQSKRTFKLRSQVLENCKASDDPEPLHQMRIGTRKLRAAFTLFWDVVDIDDPQGTQSLTKSFKKLTQALGRVRDLDVMRAWFESALAAGQKRGSKHQSGSESDHSPLEATPLSKKERKVVRSLLKTMKKRRKKQFARLEKSLKSSDYKQLKRQCKQWVKQPAFLAAAEQPAGKSAVRKIIPSLTELFAHPGWLLATQQDGDRLQPKQDLSLEQLNVELASSGEQLHDLRKQIKSIRYQTEFFRGLYDIKYAAQVREFRTLQKILGNLQDQMVIEAYLIQELGENWPEKLPTIEAAFQNSRLALWQAWQPVQAKYLALRDRLPKEMLSA